MVTAAKKKANVWAEQQVQSTWNSSTRTNELLYSSQWAQGVVLWYSWATLCKLLTNRPCSPPLPFPLSQLWHWLENRVKQIRKITQKKTFFLTHLYALKEGRKKEKTFPLTERMRRNGFEICDLQMYESGNLFFSSGEVQYMIKTLLFTSLMTPEQALMAALGQVPEPY